MRLPRIWLLQYSMVYLSKALHDQCKFVPKPKYIISALILMSYGSNCYNVYTVSQYCLLHYYYEKDRQFSYTTKSSTFAYTCLSYISMLINLCGEENMTRVIGIWYVCPCYLKTPNLRVWRESIRVFSHLLSSSQWQQTCRALRPIIKAGLQGILKLLPCKYPIARHGNCFLFASRII